MRIAWRYQNQPKFESSPSHAKFGHYFDLTRVMDEQKLSSVPVQTFSVTSEMSKCLECSEERKSAEDNVYRMLISRIKSAIKDGGFTTASEKGLENRTILRLVLHGLGSPLWGEEQHISNEISSALTRFLFQLRATLRSALAVCLVTVPTHLFQDPAFTRRVERLCDTVVKLESFVGSENETNPVYKDYHGLFHIVRLPRLNSLVSHVPDSFDLAFKTEAKENDD
ncbi:Elongator subunit elp4 [Desmophyllum pertusum]|uniref:Elongator complex protein 4 n=1 Tax=Desmophyllum pertusum TaxID=174260 RepID=A0A9W9ZR39_9CNID|nr:Elongator subunit elp4 [Desmophyllum pertusum]